MRAKLVICVAAITALTASRAISQEPSSAGQDLSSPVGLWQAVDSDTKQPTGWFLIRDDNGVYDGIIAKMFMKPGEDPNELCGACTDDRHNHPWLGLEIVRGMQQVSDDKNKYEGGTILDPRDGKVYQAMMTLSPDGQTLVVRGYIGFALLGQNQYWTRLPDSDYSMLDPSVNPNATPNPPKPSPAPHAHGSQKIAYPQNSVGR